MADSNVADESGTENMNRSWRLAIAVLVVSLPVQSKENQKDPDCRLGVGIVAPMTKARSMGECLAALRERGNSKDPSRTSFGHWGGLMLAARGQESMISNDNGRTWSRLEVAGARTSAPESAKLPARSPNPPKDLQAVPPSAPANRALTPQPQVSMEEVEVSRMAKNPCQLDVQGQLIGAAARTIEECAALLDQTAETYDSEGWKHAKWEDIPLRASRELVESLEPDGSWRPLIKRYRY